MRKTRTLFFIMVLLSATPAFSQPKDSVIIAAIVKEATDNSQLEKLGHELLDGIGPRLVGTPQMKQAHDWAVAKYGAWGITARNEKWGEWRGWERGISHIDMVYPRVKSLEGMQLAWSPGTNGKTQLISQRAKGPAPMPLFAGPRAALALTVTVFATRLGAAR